MVCIPASLLNGTSLLLGSPGGRLGIPSDRDQRSCVFLNDPKNALSSADKKTHKNTSQIP